MEPRGLSSRLAQARRQAGAASLRWPRSIPAAAKVRQTPASRSRPCPPRATCQFAVLKLGKRLRAPNVLSRSDFVRTRWIGQSQEEARRASHAGLGPLGGIRFYTLGVLSTAEAILELSACQTLGLCVSQKVLVGELALIAEDSVVHLPILPLVTGTKSGLGGLGGARMNTHERKTAASRISPCPCRRSLS